MQYRSLGKTGLTASVVGLGCEYLDNRPFDEVEPVIHAALDRGINILDIFMPGRAVRENIGRALTGNRDKVLIQGHIGSVDLREQYDMSRDLKVCREYFETLMRCLKTDYIDCGMLFFMDSNEDIDAALNNGIVAYAQELKKKGAVRAIGASAHNPVTARRLVEEGLVDMMMFSINPAFDMMPGESDIVAIMSDEPLSGKMTRADPERAAFYRLCESRGVGLTVMKTLGAGKLLSAEQTPFARPLTVHQCMHYALARPAVASVLVGCRSAEEVQLAAAYAETGDDDPAKDYSRAIGAFKTDGQDGFAGSCVYCNHCQPCPQGIDVAAVTRYLDIARLDEKQVPESVRQHYRSLARHGSDCTSCGHCERRCPFKVAVTANMADAARIFGL
ncbi:MAG: aldo/keto reductase [Deltaproteobacteria bacterium]|nr:aldo/keto reductase [Deltaproteobacteria bacterium]